eukprot:7383239-Prymnesium_polylepis.1
MAMNASEVYRMSTSAPRTGCPGAALPPPARLGTSCIGQCTLRGPRAASPASWSCAAAAPRCGFCKVYSDTAVQYSLTVTRSPCPILVVWLHNTQVPVQHSNNVMQGPFATRVHVRSPASAGARTTPTEATDTHPTTK